jgi:hypothetical protein
MASKPEQVTRGRLCPKAERRRIEVHRLHGSCVDSVDGALRELARVLAEIL